MASLMGLMPFVALAFLTFVAFSPLVIHMIAMTVFSHLLVIHMSNSPPDPVDRHSHTLGSPLSQRIRY